MSTGENSTNPFPEIRGKTVERPQEQKCIVQWRAHASKAFFVISHIFLVLAFSYFRYKSAMTKVINHITGITVLNMKLLVLRRNQHRPNYTSS